MLKQFCDICGNEVQNGDLHILHILKDDKPSVKSMDICVFCKEKIANELIPFLKGVNNG